MSWPKPYRGLRSWFLQLHATMRAIAQALALMIGLALFVWGADSLARWGAESLLARNVQQATGVTEQPEVAVKADFFLPQVIRGAYAEAHVITGEIRSGPLRIERIDSQLFDVRLAFHDVLLRNISRIGVGRSTETVWLTYDDLNAYFESTGRPLRLEPTPDGGLRVSGTVDVLRRSVAATADIDLVVDDGVLQLEPRRIDVGGANLGAAGGALLVQRLTLSVPLSALPFGHRLVAATPGPERIEIKAEGSTIVVQP
jgi:hypothetical protein